MHNDSVKSQNALYVLQKWTKTSLQGGAKNQSMRCCSSRLSGGWNVANKDTEHSRCHKGKDTQTRLN